MTPENETDGVFFSETPSQIYTLSSKYPRRAHVSLQITLNSSSTLTCLTRCSYVALIIIIINIIIIISYYYCNIFNWANFRGHYRVYDFLISLTYKLHKHFVIQTYFIRNYFAAIELKTFLYKLGITLILILLIYITANLGTSASYSRLTAGIVGLDLTEGMNVRFLIVLRVL